MIYAAAWDTTGDDRYRRQWRNRHRSGGAIDEQIETEAGLRLLQCDALNCFTR